MFGHAPSLPASDPRTRRVGHLLDGHVLDAEAQGGRPEAADRAGALGVVERALEAAADGVPSSCCRRGARGRSASRELEVASAIVSASRETPKWQAAPSSAESAICCSDRLHAARVAPAALGARIAHRGGLVGAAAQREVGARGRRPRAPPSRRASRRCGAAAIRASPAASARSGISARQGQQRGEQERALERGGRGAVELIVELVPRAARSAGRSRSLALTPANELWMSGSRPG